MRSLGIDGGHSHQADGRAAARRIEGGKAVAYGDEPYPRVFVVRLTSARASAGSDGER